MRTLATLLLSTLVPVLGAPVLGAPVLSQAAASNATVVFSDLTNWAMTIGVRNNNLSIPNGDNNNVPWTGTLDSIFVNGNFARQLMASYIITGNRSHLDEAMAWCDTLASLQFNATSPAGLPVGFWGAGYGMPSTDKNRNPCARGQSPEQCARGSIYFGDTGTAVTALSQCYRHAEPVRAQNFLDAMARYWTYVTQGSHTAPPARAANQTAPNGFIVTAGPDKGAVGCGYYGGHVSLSPYTISTATTGAAFGAEWSNILPQGEARTAVEKTAVAAMDWLCDHVQANGEIPYILDGTTFPMTQWPLDTISYVTEGIVAVDTYLTDRYPSLKTRMKHCFGRTADWLVRAQNLDGTWGKLGSADQERSPRVVTLLAWYVARVEPNATYTAAIERFMAFVADPANAKRFGLKVVPNTSGFVAIAAADVLRFGVTF